MINVSKALGSHITDGKPREWQGKTVTPNILVTIGSGKIKSLDVGDKTNLVQIDIEGLKYPFKGYFGNRGPLLKILQIAQKEEKMVCLRFEKKTKPDIDPNISIDCDEFKTMAGAQGKVVTVVAGIYDANTGKWILENEAISNPDNDPEEIKLQLGQLAGVDPIGFFDKKNDINNTTSTLNLNPQHEIAHSIIMFINFLREVENKYNYTLDNNVRKKLALSLNKGLAVIQKDLYEFVDPCDPSFKRIRKSIFNYEEKISNLTEEEMKNFKGWMISMREHVIDEYKFSLQS